jgi:hypothetical protein
MYRWNLLSSGTLPDEVREGMIRDLEYHSKALDDVAEYAKSQMTEDDISAVDNAASVPKAKKPVKSTPLPPGWKQ